MAVAMLGLWPAANVSLNLGFPVITATGLESALSCQQQQREWTLQSRAYGSSNGHLTTSTYEYIQTLTSDISKGTLIVTSLTTLCDGHARVIGQTTHIGNSSTLLTTTSFGTETVTKPATFYPTPVPCQISPEGCQSLFSSYSFYLESCSKNSATASPCGALSYPSCATFSTTGPYVYGTCTQPAIYASHARLLYWPVQTVPGSGDLCNKTASTIPGTPTGSGPNTFVTEGITITSPAVAISIGDISRYDKCGPTLASTIVVVPPEDVSSVRGARALYQWLPFDFADLNYICKTTFTSTTPGQSLPPLSDRPDCYQAVPAIAYFSGNSYWRSLGYPQTQIPGATIWPDYAPQIIFPTTLINAFHTLWGPECYMNVDGVWDPPQALQPQSYIAGVTTPQSFATPGAVQSRTTIEGVTTPSTIGAVQTQSAIGGVTIPNLPSQTSIPISNEPDVFTTPWHSSGPAQLSPTPLPPQVQGSNPDNSDGGTSEPGSSMLGDESSSPVDGSSSPSNEPVGDSEESSEVVSLADANSLTPGAVIVTSGQTLTLTSVDVSTLLLINNQTTMAVTKFATTTTGLDSQSQSTTQSGRHSTTAKLLSKPSSGTAIHPSDAFSNIAIILGIGVGMLAFLL